MEDSKKKVPFKDTMAGPTVVLLIICLVISAALSITYQVTKPKIDQINKATADAARMEVLPDADKFTEVDGDLPEGVTEYYVADNGAGEVATCQYKSFGGTITVMVGMDSEGTITGVKVTDHDDTPGVGTKAMDSSYLSEQYKGVSETDKASNIRNDSNIDQVTGATVTSNAIYQCVNEALDAYQSLGGAK
ncbi:MAG: RnfABCDGE type electron transport complex subunit G [Anaerovoracaceae bacterium]|jgi:electron transport complex protein RnfG